MSFQKHFFLLVQASLFYFEKYRTLCPFISRFYTFFLKRYLKEKILLHCLID